VFAAWARYRTPGGLGKERATCRLRGLRRVARSRFADQQMDVFGHHHVAEELKLLRATNLIENLDEAITGPRRAEQRKPTIATERKEMEIAASVIAPERIAHGLVPKWEQSETRTLADPAKSGTPRLTPGCDGP
jgi:hypothetical protein